MTSYGFSFAPGNAVYVQPRRARRLGLVAGLARVVSIAHLYEHGGTIECEQNGCTVQVRPDEITGQCGVIDACRDGEGSRLWVCSCGGVHEYTGRPLPCGGRRLGLAEAGRRIETRTDRDWVPESTGEGAR